MSYQQRNDNVPGYIYLIEAVGIKNGLYRRVKIGLTRNVNRRISKLENNQFPCDVKLLKAIAVSDMLFVEKRLHAKYKLFNVRFAKSKEWFDVPLPVLFLIKKDMESLRMKPQNAHELSWLTLAAIALIAFATSASLVALLAPEKSEKQLPQVKTSIVQY